MRRRTSTLVSTLVQPSSFAAAAKSIGSRRSRPRQSEAGPGVGINHLVIQVESLDATRADLATKGIEPEPLEHDSAVEHLAQPGGERVRVAGLTVLPAQEAAMVAREPRRLKPEGIGNAHHGALGD